MNHADTLHVLGKHGTSVQVRRMKDGVRVEVTYGETGVSVALTLNGARHLAKALTMLLEEK